jgi:hypothetical protein
MQRISANGLEVWSRQYSPKSWINSVYLRGRPGLTYSSADAWTLFGERPEQRISFRANVDNRGLQLSFSGTQPEAGFVAGILAETEADFPVRRAVEAERADWWRKNWPVQGLPPEPSESTEDIPAVNQRPLLQALQGEIIAAPDTSTNLLFDLFNDDSGITPSAKISAPNGSGWQLSSRLYWGHWMLRRSALASTLLKPTNRYLRTHPPAYNQIHGLPARLHVRIDVPAGAPAGVYLGDIQVQVGETVLHSPLRIRVVHVVLPKPNRPIGAYLERPVHFDWFEETRILADRALECDLRFLRRQGLTGIAPPLSTPVSHADFEKFVEQIRSAAATGFTPPYFAYTPLKRLQQTMGIDAALTRLAELEQRLKQMGLPPPLWASADEPSNPGQEYTADKIKRYASAFSPTLRLAGQLNNPKDKQRLDAFDVVLINQGYGIDRADVDNIKAQGINVWFYNLDNLRAAAGFYLWRTGADGYLHWHARMPTADPFDPTDGREDDIQFLYPMTDPCPSAPDVDVDLFRLSEGIVDLRWLLWLENRALTDKHAHQLLS